MHIEFQSTLSVWRATAAPLGGAPPAAISIHALRVESDSRCARRFILSTHISIHALRVESDVRRQGHRKNPDDFNPRSPCGERLTYKVQDRAIITFQSTLSVWRATTQLLRLQTHSRISIHALRVESDGFKQVTGELRGDISIHALRVESDYFNGR